MERSDDMVLGNSGPNSNMQNGDINAVMNSSNSNTNNNNNSNIQQNERTSNSYTMPGILHYLQHEWNRFEFERQQWEVDRAELMSKISFLQGERRGQENLKNNLIRRIKMLEYALKQERIKYNKLKFGDEQPASVSNSSNDSKTNQTNEHNDTNENETSTFSISQHPILNKENTINSNSIKQGRQLLKQYLQEIGCTDTIIDIRSARLRTLLGLKTLNQSDQSIDIMTQNTNQIDQLSNLLNGNKQLLQLSINNNNINNNNINSINTSNKRSLSGTNSNINLNTNQINGNLNTNEVQKILKLTSNTDADALISNLEQLNQNTNNNNNDSNSNAFYDDEEMREDDQLKSKNNNQTDLDTEDALKEFSFLSAESSSSSSDMESDWNVDKEQLNKLTEQYKKDRKSSKNAKNQIALNPNVISQRPNKSDLQAMIANLTEQTTTSDEQSNSQVSNLPLNNVTIISKSNQPTIDLSPNMSSSKQKLSNSPAKLFNLEDDQFVNDANLGELSRISVNNSINLSGLNDDTVVDSNRRAISNKHSLRGHFDSIRCLAFHPTESVLLSGSEDQTIKLWNLDKSCVNNKKNSNTDIEPIYTFRKHTGPVLSLVVSSNGDHCISSGLDSNIIIWNMPNHETTDQYDAYSPSVFVKYLNGHTDAVWNMALVDNTLVSVSADSTIRIWNPFSIDDLNEASSESISCLNENKNEGIPTSIDFINNEISKIVTSFGASHHNLYDIETSKIITRFDYFDSTSNTHCYKVISHPSLASTQSLIVSAHEDKKIRFFDVNSGKLVYQMVAHQDACTDLAIDPTCYYLLSSSHDCSIRLWNLENKNCIQEMTSHRKKYDESINCVAFHPSKAFIASGGADAIVKIYV